MLQLVGVIVVLWMPESSAQDGKYRTSLQDMHDWGKIHLKKTGPLLVWMLNNAQDMRT